MQVVLVDKDKDCPAPISREMNVITLPSNIERCIPNTGTRGGPELALTHVAGVWLLSALDLEYVGVGVLAT